MVPPLNLFRRAKEETVPRAKIDFKYIRDNVAPIAKNCKNRKLKLVKSDIQAIADKYTAYARTVAQLNEKLAARNNLSKQIKTAGADQRQALLEEAGLLKPKVQELEVEIDAAEEEMLISGSLLPNTTSPQTPIGNEDKVRILDYINQDNQHSIPPDDILDHVAILQHLDMVDFEAAARTSGTGFYYLKNDAVLLELALTQYALSKALKAGFKLLRCPDLVRSEFVQACGFQPRDEHGEQIYETANGALSLVGTAEIPIAALGVDKVWLETELPYKYVAVGRAFRAEAGARGADTRGLYRVHEFTKIELFGFTTPEQSEAFMNEVLGLQRSIVKELGLCARILEMPTEELGASAYRKIDIEAWIPSRGDWGEITSTSNCTDYQARRLNARFKSSKGEMSFVHTVNGTAIAIPRLMVAGLETWWHTKGNKVVLPEALRAHMGAKEIVSRS